jgi:hypothetical protein
LIRLWQSQFLTAHPRTFHIFVFGGIVIARTRIHGDVQNPPENRKRSVYHRRGIHLSKPRPPFKTVKLRDAFHIHLFQASPSFEKVNHCSIVIFFGSVFNVGCVFLTFFEDGERIAKSHFSDNLGLRRRDGAMFSIQHVCQTQLGYRENVGIE